MAEKKHSVHFDITADDKASAALAAVEKKLTNVVLAAVSIGGIGASFTAFMADAIKTRSALDDLSDTTGDNVRTLDGLRRQAAVTGIEFEQMSTGLTKFARNLNASDDEGQAAAQAIGAIGLKVGELRAMKPADAMFEVAKALGGFEDGASKVAVAVALMGKEGAKMLPFLKDLAEAGELNGRITAEQAAQAERTEKEWRKLTQAFKDGKDSIADGLIPVMGDYAEQMRKGIELTGGLGKAIVALGTINPFKSFQANIDQRMEELRTLQARAANPNIPDVFKNDGSRIKDLNAQIEFLKFQQRQQALHMTGPEFLDARDLQAAKKPKLDFVPTGADKGDKSDPFATEETRLQKMIAEIGGGAEKVAAQMAAALKTDPKLKDGPQERKDRLMALAEEADRKKQGLEIGKKQIEQEQEINDARRERGEQLTKEQIAQREAGDAIRKQLDPTIELEEKTRAIAQLVKDGMLSVEDGEAAFDKLTTDFAKADAAANTFGTSVDDVAKTARELGMTFSSAFEDAIVGGKDLRSVLQGLAQDVARIFVRKTTTEPMANFLSDLFKPGLSGLFSGVIPKFDVGTPYVPNDMLAMIHKGERIVPAAENMRGMSGGADASMSINPVSIDNAFSSRTVNGGAVTSFSITIPQNFSVSGDVSPGTVSAILRAAKQGAASAAIGAVAEMRRRAPTGAMA